MNFQSIVSLVLSLLGKREEIVSIVKDAIALINRIKATVPVEQLTALAQDVSPTSTYSIQWLQESLNKLVGSTLKVDGSYGQGTQDAVKKFQAAHGLVADGWAGVQTQAAIVDALK